MLTGGGGDISESAASEVLLCNDTVRGENLVFIVNVGLVMPASAIRTGDSPSLATFLFYTSREGLIKTTVCF